MQKLKKIQLNIKRINKNYFLTKKLKPSIKIYLILINSNLKQ